MQLPLVTTVTGEPPHRGTSCTVRRQVSLGYLNNDGKNAALCDICYPHPRLLAQNQLRLTPCQRRYEVCASGPPAPLGANATQTSIALAWGLGDGSEVAWATASEVVEDAGSGATTETTSGVDMGAPPAGLAA